MFEIHWNSFFLALIVLIFAANLFNLAVAFYRRGRARKEADLAEKELKRLQGLLNRNEKELDDLLDKGQK